MHAFVGADRQRMRDVAQDFVPAGGQGLFDEGNALLRGKSEVCDDVVVGPALVGIKDDSALRRGLSHRLDAGDVVVAADLDLQQRAAGVGAGLRRHRLGFAKRQRVGGFQRTQRSRPDRVCHRLAADLGFKIPQRAVDGVARGSRRHCVEQSGAVDTAGDPLTHGLDRAMHAVHGLAIALVGNAFTATAMSILADRAGDDLGLGLGAARNGEGAGDRKTFGLNRNDTRHIFLLRLCEKGCRQIDKVGPIRLNRTPC